MSALERFLRSLDQHGNGACWIWTGAKTREGYGELMVAGRMAYAHRFAYELIHGPIPDGMHLDHGPVCHRRDCVNPDHLRLATPGQNCCNQRIRKNNKSGFKGVHWSKQANKWVAKITLNHKTKHLGRFDTAEDAHLAYCAAAAEIHGDFANPGTI